MTIATVSPEGGTLTIPRIVLPDTSLCAIVRDELMNPAGGIRDFVISTVPFVEEAVILDTGSVDGTRQVLEELQAQYPNLRVFDHEFEGYAASRNRSLGFVQTKRALILDADERLTRADFVKLIRAVTEVDRPKYVLPVVNVTFNGGLTPARYAHNPRMFNMAENLTYEYHVGEVLCHQSGISAYRDCYFPGAKIKHFIPDKAGMKIKKQNWYVPLERSFPGKRPRTHYPKTSPPSQSLSFASWKKLNPHREKYR